MFKNKFKNVKNIKNTYKKLISMVCAIACIGTMLCVPMGVEAVNYRGMTPTSNKIYNGCDISYYQSNFNFLLAKQQGYQIVYIRSSLAGSKKDKSFKTHYYNAKNAGILVGAYHFLYVGYGYTVDDNVNNALSVVKGYKFDCKYCIDCEDESLCGQTLSKSYITTFILQFASKFTKATGIPCIVYSNTSFIAEHFDSRITSLPIWIADMRNPAYLSQNSLYSKWVGFQFTDQTHISNSLHTDTDYFTDGVLINTNTGDTSANSKDNWGNGVYTVNKSFVGICDNANATKTIAVYDKNGKLTNHTISNGDNMKIANTTGNNCFEVFYDCSTLSNKLIHGYVSINDINKIHLYHNNDWKNGSTAEKCLSFNGKTVLATVKSYISGSYMYKWPNGDYCVMFKIQGKYYMYRTKYHGMLRY